MEEGEVKETLKEILRILGKLEKKIDIIARNNSAQSDINVTAALSAAERDIYLTIKELRKKHFNVTIELIAKYSGLSYPTVSHHVSNLMKKKFLERSVKLKKIKDKRKVRLFLYKPLKNKKC